MALRLSTARSVGQSVQKDHILLFTGIADCLDASSLASRSYSCWLRDTSSFPLAPSLAPLFLEYALGTLQRTLGYVVRILFDSAVIIYHERAGQILRRLKLHRLRVDELIIEPTRRWYLEGARTMHRTPIKEGDMRRI